MFGKELWLVGRPVADRLTAASFPEVASCAKWILDMIERLVRTQG